MEVVKKLAKKREIFSNLFVINAICILAVFVAIVLILAIIPYETAIYSFIPLLVVFVSLVITFAFVLSTLIMLKYKLVAMIKKMVLERITKILPHTKCYVYVSSADDCKYIIKISADNSFNEDVYWCINRIVDEINENLTNIILIYLIV